METESFGRVFRVFSRSCTAMWWVSLSESFEREVRIFCLSSIVARWEEEEREIDFWRFGVWDLAAFVDLGFAGDDILMQKYRSI